MAKLDFSKKPQNIGVKVEKKETVKFDSADINRVVKIPTNLIDIGENIRNEKNDAELEELAESIKEYGQLEPVIVYKEGERYTVKVGSRRTKACMVYDIPTVDCIIAEHAWKDEKERIILQAIENEHRINMSTKERETYIKKLQDMGMSNVEIAAALHKPKSMITEALKALEAREENADIFENLEGEATSRSAYDFGNLSEEQKEKVKAEKERIKNKEKKEPEISNDEVNEMFDIDSDDSDISDNVVFDDDEESENPKEVSLGINLNYSINETDKVFKWTSNKKEFNSKVEKFIINQIENFYLEEGYTIG